MGEHKPIAEIDRLTDLCVRRSSSTLTQPEVKELGELLDGSAEARREYWRLTAIHSELDWEFGAARELPVARSGHDLLPPGGWAGRLTAGTTTGMLAWVAIAASLVVAVSLTTNQWGTPADGRATLGSNNEESKGRLGVISPLMASTAWSFGRSGADNTSEVFAGDTISLDEGAFELRLASSTVATFEAPAIVQTVSNERFRLLRGGVKVEVAKGDEGFTVETASAEIIDLGTVFSVSFDNGETDLVVFDGEVDLKVVRDRRDTSSPLKRFHAGEAVQVERNGTLSRIVQVNQSPIASESTNGGVGPVISSVRDDNTRDDFWRFYEIVPGGMREDAAAFVDRPHQWNGKRGGRLPAYLLGGDYVKTFNDDKVASNLNIEVKLSRPADLFVLLDTRVKPPAWLLADFEDTGDLIGVDEGHSSPANESQRLASGPGVSIDRVHSVWKQKEAWSGPVFLGPNGKLANDTISDSEAPANMYGIVAVPRTRG